MKKSFINNRVLWIGALFLSAHYSYAQQGFGTDKPNKATVLDMTSTSKGVLFPRVALINTTTFQPISGIPNNTTHTANSLIVYNTTTSGSGNTTVTPGFYYWEKATATTSGKWTRLINSTDLINSLKTPMPKFFYMPSVVLPLHPDHITNPSLITYNNSTATFTVDLYKIYKEQFELTGSNSVANPNRTTTLPVLPANELDYYITYFDNTVYSNVSVTNDGKLRYKVIATSDATNASFMNIVFAVKP
ncbi:hypothetical protein AB4865_03785 [Capnocytophaga sp. ARDL2]|uniref:hypothetical protein n=1 Tax=Capnocytophaga sp. ARDL2 TaxID=3238809 RepID=UPI0035578508